MTPVQIAEPLWYVGLMSGTSFDGIDVGLLRTDGEDFLEFGPTATIPHPDRIRSEISNLLGQLTAPRPFVEELTDAHADAVRSLLRQAELAPSDVRAIGFHGQTIHHAPKQRITVQLGDGERLANSLGIDVIDQFRLADVQAGGEGAPLAPIFHQALMRGLPKPVAMVNIGGVANITWTDGVRLIACDTGPGNARLDDLMRAQAGQDYDQDGAVSASGAVDEQIVAGFLQQSFFRRPAPKSLDRQELACAEIGKLSRADAAATLSAITADSIVASFQHLPCAPELLIITGGGRWNRAMMRRLRANAGARVISAEEAGWNGDGMEAYLFAYLAARRLRDLPSSFPETTGVPHPMNAGRICCARNKELARSGSRP